MTKLKADFLAEIWNGEIDAKNGVTHSVAAEIKFGTQKPRCSRCANRQQRVVVTFQQRTTETLRLCMTCIGDLIQGINNALQQFKLVHTVLTGKSVGEAIEEIKKGGEVTTSDLQSVFDSFTRQISRHVEGKSEEQIIAEEVTEGIGEIQVNAPKSFRNPTKIYKHIAEEDDLLNEPFLGNDPF